MTNKGILKRKEHRRRNRERKAEVLKMAKYFYENCPPIIPELDLRMSPELESYFKGVQSIDLYLRGMGIRQKSTLILLPPSS